MRPQKPPNDQRVKKTFSFLLDHDQAIAWICYQFREEFVFQRMNGDPYDLSVQYLTERVKPRPTVIRRRIQKKNKLGNFD